MGILPTATLAQETNGGDADPGPDSHLPVRHTERPLTLPELTLAPGLHLYGQHVEFGNNPSNAFLLGAGAELGITDDFQIELVPASFVFGDPDPDYGYFIAGMTYRFLDGDVDFGGRFRFAIDNAANTYFTLGFPLRYRSEIVRIDTGIEMVVAVFQNRVGSSGEPIFGLWGFGGWPFISRSGLPVDVALQLADPLWIGVATGATVSDVTEFGDTISMQLGPIAGATVPGDQGPLLDLDAGLRFPWFLNSSSFFDNPVTEYWEFGATVKAYAEL